MLDLILQTALAPVIVPVAVDVACGLQLVVDKLLCLLFLRREGVSCQMADRELNVQDARRDVRDHQEAEAFACEDAVCRAALRQQAHDRSEPQKVEP